MINEEKIRMTEDFLRRKLSESPYFKSNPSAGSYRLEHSYRVANIGREIAMKEGFDETEMVIACLLHDIAYCEEFGENGWLEHGRRSAQISRPFLKGLGVPADRIEDICYGIAIHVDDKADFPGERTPFAVTVGDADNIDRFDAYRIHEVLAKEDFIDMTYEGKLEFTGKRLEKLRDLLSMPMGTKSAEIMWKERMSFYITFYEKLTAQLRSSTAVI